jgi:hypothetical protein
MTRITIAFGLCLGLALAACGGQDDAQEAARKAEEATQVTVESAPQAGQPTTEGTQATVESAKGGEEPAED